MRISAVILSVIALAGCERPPCGDGQRWHEERGECVAAPSELPVGRASHDTDLTITLQADGTYLLGATPLDRETLRTRVQRRVAAAMAPVHVTLSTPPGASPARIVETTRLLRSWGVDEVDVETSAAPG